MLQAHLRRAIVILIAGSVLFLSAAQPAYAIDFYVGNGTPGSCTEAAFANAVSYINTNGGNIYFNCGGAVTIPITSAKVFNNSTKTFTIDGGGLITLDGQNTTRILLHYGGTLNIRNITFIRGRATGVNDDASGGAIRSDNGTGALALNLTNVTFRSNSTVLTGVSGGYGGVPFSPFDFGGGAVYTRLGYLTVTNSVFESNVANNSAGGAIHGRSSQISISGVRFTTNASNGGGFGGAIHVDGISPAGSNGTLQISSSLFSGNTAYNQAGALYFYLYNERNESVTISYSSFLNNRVVDNSGTIPFMGTRGIGGAIAGDHGHLTLRNSTIANNSARSSTGGGAGGGLSLVNNGTITIINTTISGNRAEGSNSDASGGGLVIYNNAQPFNISYSTIVNNYAGWTGGGIQSTTNGVLSNTIVAHNQADNGGNTWNIMDQCSSQLSSGGPVIQFPDIIGSPGSQNPRCIASPILSDPLIDPLANNGGSTQTHALRTGSPAINAGTCSVNIDQRGVTRPQGATCDIGAFEYGGQLANVRMAVDGPASGQTVNQTFTVAGWAFDSAAGQNNGPGVDLVSIHNGSNCTAPILNQGAPNVSRPDVRNAFSLDQSYTTSGYSLPVTAPSGGSFTFTVCARSVVTGQYAGSITRTVTVNTSNPRMNIDTPANNSTVASTFTVSGWAFDSGAATGPGVNLVRIFSGSACSGTILADATLGISRPDVQSAFGLPSSFSNTSFSASVTLPGGGTQQFTVCARSTVTNTFAVQMTRTVSNSDTRMHIDTPANNAGVVKPFNVSGWAFDRGAATGPGVNLVRIFSGNACSGTILADATLGISRPDVQAAFGLPSSFSNTGFSAQLNPSVIGALTFTVCARSTVTGTFAAQITRTVTISNTQMNVDSPSSGQTVARNFQIQGWAFDNGAGQNGPGVSAVTVYQGGTCSGTVLANAALGISRSDVQSAFNLPSSYSHTGFSAAVSANPGSLTFTVCVRSSVTNTFTRSLTRSVNVSGSLGLDAPPTATPTPTPSVTPSPTLTWTPTLAPTDTATSTPLPTDTPTNTATDTPTPVPPTATPTDTASPSPTLPPTDTPTPEPPPDTGGAETTLEPAPPA